MNNALNDLITISRAVGSDPLLTEAASGNTSVKTDDHKYIYIKSSGTAIKNITEEAGWRKLDLIKLRSLFNDSCFENFEPAQRNKKLIDRMTSLTIDGLSEARPPSVESQMHAMLDNKFVVHIHPAAVGAYICSNDWRSLLESLFANSPTPIMLVPYACPGYDLAKTLHQKLAEYHKKYSACPNVIFLQNHGLVISENTKEKTLSTLDIAIKTCSANLKNISAPVEHIENKKITEIANKIASAISEFTDQPVKVKYFTDNQIAWFAKESPRKDIFSPLPISPEEILYTAGPAVWLENPSLENLKTSIKQRIKLLQKLPTGFLIKSIGLFVAYKNCEFETVKNILKNSLLTRLNALEFSSLHFLTPKQIHQLLEIENPA